jgi:hypothetical protein
MRLPTLLVSLAGAAFATAVLIAQTTARNPQPRAYTGSAACRECHQPEYESWQRNLHVQMTRPIADARITGDFGKGVPTRLEAHGRSYAMENRGGRYVISVARNGRPPESFEIHYTLGARRFQGYLSRLPDGRIYVLPVFWHAESGRWIDYEEITPIPKDTDHDLRQIWNVSCVNCHATNLARNFDAATNTFSTTWTEMGIGCEACHGPGAAHVADPEHLKIFTMKKVPPREVFDTCAYCHGNKNNVFFGFKAGDRYDDYALPFLISQPVPDNDPQGDFWPDGRPSRFNRPQALTETGCFQKGQATCTSCHRMHGAENSHSLKVDIDAPDGGHSRESDTLCTQCHAPGTLSSGGPSTRDASAILPDRSNARVDSHTHHAPESQGSRCINCHMSDVNWRLFTRRLDHTFQPPVPEMTAAYGAPNACTTCHEDRSPEWAARMLDEWYGNGERRQRTVSMADTMFRAGSGDASVLPDLVRLAVDRSHGALIRASAAEFAGQLLARSGAQSPTDVVARPASARAGTQSAATPPQRTSMGQAVAPGPPAGARATPAARGGSQAYTPAIVNGLIGAANDQEAWVRITAVRALGSIREPRILSVLTAHLVDSSRVVRVSAAEALMDLGVTTLDGPAGEALARAQDEWVESLRTFNDDSHDQTTLGWLEAARGQTNAALEDLTTATKLDPSNARPHVFLGVLMARAGRFDEALKHFKTAKALAPAYPNIERLIEEAEKRR